MDSAREDELTHGKGLADVTSPGTAADCKGPEGVAGPHPEVSGHGRGDTRLLWLGLVSVVVSLVLRTLHRGQYYPGFDIVGAAQGLLLVSTKGPLEILRWYADYHYFPNFGLGWNAYGAPLVLLPGWLTAIIPWEYWAHVVTFVGTLLSFGLLGRAFGLRGPEWAVIVLAWGASSAMLSYSICGFAYLSSA
jgi:hypothetical protein